MHVCFVTVLWDTLHFLVIVQVTETNKLFGRYNLSSMGLGDVGDTGVVGMLCLAGKIILLTLFWIYFSKRCQSYQQIKLNCQIIPSHKGMINIFVAEIERSGNNLFACLLYIRTLYSKARIMMYTGLWYVEKVMVCCKSLLISILHCIK